MINTEIRLIIFFAAKDGEALYSQQKQDRELIVAQFMNSYEELGQESQASSCVEEWNSACLSSCSQDNRPFVEL